MKEAYKVEGMTCNHCATHVTEALETVDAVKSAKVSLKKQEVIIKTEEAVDFEILQTAVADAGYTLRRD